MAAGDGDVGRDGRLLEMDSGLLDDPVKGTTPSNESKFFWASESLTNRLLNSSNFSTTMAVGRIGRCSK